MVRTFRILKGCIATLLTLAAFASPQARADANDVIGPGDSVRVTVFNNPDLTTEARISSRGALRMPLIGEVDLTGLSPADASTRIAGKLKHGQFLKDPQVSVTVMQARSRQVSVLGQVTRPGRYALEDGSRLADALALAGGVTATGDETVTILSGRDRVKQVVNLSRMYRNADPSANVELHTGDTVYVNRAPVFYIYGEVQHAGSYRLDGDINVMQAISLGGGITPRGTERGLRISRKKPDGSVEDITVQPGDRVQPDDVIHVKESLF